MYLHISKYSDDMNMMWDHLLRFCFQPIRFCKSKTEPKRRKPFSCARFCSVDFRVFLFGFRENVNLRSCRSRKVKQLPYRTCFNPRFVELTVIFSKLAKLNSFGTDSLSSLKRYFPSFRSGFRLRSKQWTFIKFDKISYCKISWFLETVYYF